MVVVVKIRDLDLQNDDLFSCLMTFGGAFVHSWLYVPLYARLGSTLLMRKPLINANSVDCVPLNSLEFDMPCMASMLKK